MVYGGPDCAVGEKFDLIGRQLPLECLDLVDQGLPLGLPALLGHVLERPIVDVDLLQQSDVLLHQGHDPEGEKHDHADALLGHPLPEQRPLS